MAQKTLTLYLGKADIEDFEQVFTEEAKARLQRATTKVVDAPQFGDGGRLFVFVGIRDQPKWLVDVRRSFPFPDEIWTTSAAGVLLFRSADRLFASTFAHGWMYLDEHCFEGDFGLRAAINALDDKKLKRLERANLGDALRAVSHSPFQRGLTTFGMDDALDLVRKVSGRTRADASADTMSGSRSLRLTGEFGLEDLPELAADALEYYGSANYQQTDFSILDSVMPVSDLRLAETLDNLAAASIREGEDNFEFGLPIGYDDQAVSYKFRGPRCRGARPDLLLRDYVAAMGDRIDQLTAQTLHDHKIVAVFDDDARPDATWSVKASLVGSLVHDNERFATNEGEWFRIEQQFKDAIESSFNETVEEWAVAPEPLRKIYDEKGNGHYEAEAAYNQRFAQSNGYVLLDRALVKIPGIDRSDFESCDVLDIAGKRFLHVKKSSRRSSVLSHFFKQGANSARHFSTFAAAWTELRVLVVARAGEAAGQMLDEVCADDRPWKIEFIIADTPRQDGRFNIPFFSKVSLRDEIRTMRAMRYDTALKFVGLQPDRHA